MTPPADGPHADSLTDLTFAFAPAHGAETRVAQAMGVWLPDGPEDYAIPDLAVVDADYRDHLVADNCYDPVVFRMVLEVTSSNYATDLKTKVPRTRSPRSRSTSSSTARRTASTP